MADTARIVDEFKFLLEKSQQLFAGLRDLPQFGRSQWQPYFQRTFEVFTKLWKYQQQHRPILDVDANYGLKRHQIGEIASKIGQLYYHYYLRTAESYYLAQSHQFYEAIRERQYFKDVTSEQDSSLVVKKLRCYARHIVVCLLLNDVATVSVLYSELNTSVSQYVNTYSPGDATDWQVVLREIEDFLTADYHVKLADKGAVPPRSLRLKDPLAMKKEAGEQRLRVSDAILVGNNTHQVKFSELTLDMFRMLQLIEREGITGDGSATTGEVNPETDKKKVNPHKYLLYRPSLSQFLVFLSTAFKELPARGAMLIYLSCDGVRATTGDRTLPCSSGGVSTNPRPEAAAAPPESDSIPVMDAIYAEDLLAFTRKPMFVVVDSTGSASYQILGERNVFGQPVVCLMSPTLMPSRPKVAPPAIGNLFTFFLADPLNAFCALCEIKEISQDAYNRSIRTIHSALTVAVRLLSTTAGVDFSYQAFMQDDFLRVILARYVWCQAVFSLYSASAARPEARPNASPALPAAVTRNATLLEHVLQLAAHLDVARHFEAISI